MKRIQLMVFLIFTLNIACLGQDFGITYEQQQKLQEYFDNNSKIWGFSKQVQDAVFSEHKDFFGNYADALLAIDLANKFANAQDKQLLETIIIEVSKKGIEKLYPSMSSVLSWASWAKTGMELLDQFVVTPARIGYSLDFYFDLRDKGYTPGEASWSTKDYGQLSMALKKEFRKQYGDFAFKEISPSGLTLLPKWDAKFNRFLESWIEVQYINYKVKKDAAEILKSRIKEVGKGESKLLKWLKEKQKELDKEYECDKNEHWDESTKDCECNDGYSEDKDGDCVKIKNCDENEHWDVAEGDCECNSGFTENKKGNCIKVKKCGDNEEWNAEDGDCGCKDGYSEDKDGDCVKIKNCDENEHWDVAEGSCECNSGFTENKKGNCIKVEKCGDNEEWNAEDGDCGCKDGFKETEDGICVEDKEIKVTIELTYPAGQSPKVFTSGWIFGTKATMKQGDDPVRDISNQVNWSGSGTFAPSKGAISRPTFSSVGRNAIKLTVTIEGQTFEENFIVKAVDPILGEYQKIGDISYCPNDSHGCLACPHSVKGPITTGSPNVTIGGLPAARVGDTGVHAVCCGPNTFKILEGDNSVLINGKPAARKGDKTQHCGGPGLLGIMVSKTDEADEAVEHNHEDDSSNSANLTPTNYTKEDILANSDCSEWPNMEPKWDSDRKEAYCDCKDGYSWDEDLYKCITEQEELLNNADCSQYPNAHAILDSVTQEVICDCLPGFEWHKNGTECISKAFAVLQNMDCSMYTNSEAVWDPVSEQAYCDCSAGYQWNEDYTACVQIVQQQQTTDLCAHIPNSRAVFDAGLNTSYCDCLPGYKWNKNQTTCILIPKKPTVNWDNVLSMTLGILNAANQNNQGITPSISGNPGMEPATQHQSSCNDEQQAGGDPPEEHTIDLGTSYGNFNFDYNTYTQKDQIIITNGGVKIFDSGCVGERKSIQLSLRGISPTITVRINPNCEGGSGTSWDFTVHCPNN